jgi:hypothetical protein
MNDIFSLPPALMALYAEIHYTFRLGFSLLRTDFPEIIADLPWRVEPGQNIPVLCFIKDADQYPVFLDQVVVTGRWGQKGFLSWSFPLKVGPIKEHFWHRILEIPGEMIPPGPVKMDVLFVGRRRDRPFRFRNDNYRRLSHAPLEILKASQPLPNLPSWYPGDPHVHSSFTEDQVEFGAPPEAISLLAKTMGLSWAAITDHSYDLDDRPGDPLTQDPGLQKWHRLMDLIPKLNRAQGDFVTLLGQEVSCGSSGHRNVHLLAFGVSNFIPGAGDGAERWLHTQPTMMIPEVLEKIRQAGGVAYAAHPTEMVSILEKLLLRRGSWTMADLSLPGLSGLQVWNGKKNHGLEMGLDRWVQLLLRGKRSFVIGGNDAHGNFNRFRQLKLPFVAMRESGEQVFGRVRTHLYCPQGVSSEDLLHALRHGQAVATDGPFAAFQVRNERGLTASLGQSVGGEEFFVDILAKSSSEFGSLERIDLHCGEIGGRKESRVRSLRRGKDFAEHHEASHREGPFRTGRSSYLRLEVETAAEGRTWHAMTNPIWLNYLCGAEKDGEYPG